MKRLVIAAVMLCMCGYTKADSWEPVPNPTVKLNHVSVGYGLNGQGMPLEAGSYSVAYAMVDRFNKQSPWSDTVTINVTKNQYWYTDIREYVKSNFDTIGMVWKINESFAANIYGGVGPYQVRTKYGWSPLFPQMSGSLQKVPGYSFRPVSTVLAKPDKPVIYLSNVPNDNLEVAYCWVCNTGETELSPIEVSVKSTYADGPQGVTRFFNMYGCQRPVGILGYRIYARKQGTDTWYRQTNADFRPGNAPTPDDFLFSVDNIQPCLLHWREIEQPQPAAVKESLLTDFQVRLKNAGSIDSNPSGRGEKITMIGNSKINCPFMDNDRGPIAGVGNFLKFWMTVDGAGFTVSKNDQQLVHPQLGTLPSFGKNWPMIAICNQKSTWRNMFLVGNGSDCGVCLYDYYGGCAFSNTIDSLSIGNVAYGIRILLESTYTFNGHSASEFLVTDTNINASRLCYWVCPNQSAGCEVRSVYRNCEFVTNSDKWFDAVFRIETASPFYCPGKINVQGPNIFDLGGQTVVHVGRIWLDQGCQVFANCFSYYTGSITVNGEKLNFWSNCWLYKNPCGTEQTVLKITDTALQKSNVTIGVFSNRYNGVTFNFSGSPSFPASVLLSSPSYAEWVKNPDYTNPDWNTVNGVGAWTIPSLLKDVNTLKHLAR